MDAPFGYSEIISLVKKPQAILQPEHVRDGVYVSHRLESSINKKTPPKVRQKLSGALQTLG